jgi:hypothetical protein
LDQELPLQPKWALEVEVSVVVEVTEEAEAEVSVVAVVIEEAEAEVSVVVEVVTEEAEAALVEVEETEVDEVDLEEVAESFNFSYKLIKIIKHQIISFCYNFFQLQLVFFNKIY